jgi:hypothetical protein
MGRKGSFAVPLIESFLVPCHPDTFLPDRTARRTLTIILNITVVAADPAPIVPAEEEDIDIL